MEQKKKYRLFVVSDLHGHYTQLRKALRKAGFDEKNENHMLVCCGDLFDRGQENRKVYQYIQRLERKILIRGNHDARLAKVLKERKFDGYDFRNGGIVTLEEFFGTEVLGASGELLLPKYGKMAGKLCRLIDSMIDYLETEHYVFTHGWLPLTTDEEHPRIRSDWRTADPESWHRARFAQWNLIYDKVDRLPGKTIVCGHRHTRLAYQVDASRTEDDFSIFYGRGMIAIDGGTVLSDRVNVLVLEEEL